MKRLVQLLRRFEFHLLLAVVASFVFVRPRLLPAGVAAPADMMVAYYAPWAVVIAILFLIGRAQRDSRDVGEASRDDLPPVDPG